MYLMCFHIVTKSILNSKVPDAIKSQYKNPLAMMLPAGIRDGELICSGTSEAVASDHLCSDEEQQQVLTSRKQDKKIHLLI